METTKIGLLLISSLLICSLFIGCGGTGSPAKGQAPNNAVPLGESLKISIPWESADAELTILEAKEVTQGIGTTTRSLAVKVNCGATGKSGGICPYYAHEFSVVGSKGTLYGTSFIDKVEVLSGHSTIKEMSFSGIDQGDSNFLLVFHVLSLSGREDKISYFALK